MNPIELARAVEEKYRQYLTTTFYFKDPDLRLSFAQALASGRLSRGPFLEATPVFKRGKTPEMLFDALLGGLVESGFVRAAKGNRPLYEHQERAIVKVFGG